MNNPEINTSFLNSLNDAFGFISYYPNWSETGQIIPKEKTHAALLDAYTISPEIYHYYNKLNLFETIKETVCNAAPFPEKYKGKSLTPFNLKICNAYYYRPDFIYILGQIVKKGNIFCNGKRVKRLQDLKPYFIDYEKGFKNGYTNFEADNINFIDPTFLSQDDRLKKVFDFITKNRNEWGKLTFSASNKSTHTEINKAYEKGRLYGYFYKAWTIVFYQSEFFEPLFKELKNKQTSTIQSTKKKPIKKKAKTYAVTYALDCLAQGKKVLFGKKTACVAFISKSYNPPMTSGRVYRVYNDNQHLFNKINQETTLNTFLGDNWEETVLSLSTDKEALTDYIKKEIKTT